LAKKKQKSIAEMEQALSPEGLKLAKKARRAINAMTLSTVTVTKSPERDAINELVTAYMWQRKS
jgi:hypothetical protein